MKDKSSNVVSLDSVAGRNGHPSASASDEGAGLQKIYARDPAFQQEEIQELANRDAALMLRKARMAAGLTQAELAERMGVRQPALSRLEVLAEVQDSDEQRDLRKERDTPAARSPSVRTLANYLLHCGFELKLDFVPLRTDVG